MRAPPSTDTENPDSQDEPAQRREFLEQASMVLDIIRGLSIELHPHTKAGLQVTPDSSLDGDLGLDSLSRVELLVRLEKALGLTLPDHVLASADTPHDLIRAIERNGNSAWKPLSDTEARAIAKGTVKSRPDDAKTLIEMLEWQVNAHPGRTHIYFYEDAEQPAELSYQQLMKGAREVAAGLVGHDLQPGQAVAIMLPSGFDYFFSFFGILLAGGVPVPIYPPARPSQIEDHLRRHTGILDNAQTAIMITVPEAKIVARLLKMQVSGMRHVVTVRELSRDDALFVQRPAAPEDTALLQYTSGSTGTPKGVVLSHQNLMTNVRLCGDGMGITSNDVFVSWLPLYHDMGLIGAWLGALFFAMPLVLMSPLTFLARPERWLWAIHHHRGTVSAAPNFAYELCAHRIEAERIEGLDLSSWRVSLNGAEAVIPGTVRGFNARFAPYGLRPQTITPVYGLAEATLGVAFSPMEREMRTDRVRRDVFERSGLAEPAREDDSDALEFVDCGQPLPGIELRAVNEASQELGEREVGRLQFKSPSATSGYHRNFRESSQIRHGDWVDTGDLAYIVQGSIYLTGRRKDVIIRAGRNIYPPELEDAVSNLPGVRKGCVAVFGSSDASSGTERLVVLAESREQERTRLDEIRRAVGDTAMELLGIAPDDVMVVPPHSVLKTSSGKIRRAACRELYERGMIGAKTRSVWRQVLRVWLAGIGPQLRRTARLISELAYGAYWLALLALLGAATWIGIALTPKAGWSYKLLSWGTRLLFRLTGIPLLVRGREHLPAGKPCLLVFNHSSYLDGLIVAAAFPQPMTYVARREFTGNFFARVFFSRLGCVLAANFDKQQGAEDTRAIAAAAKERRLVIFPEATFVRAPGLLPFQMGAFVASAEAGVPIVPVVVRGARSVLRDEQWLPRRGVITVNVLPPIAPGGSGWDDALELRDRVRAEMLRHYGEPDMKAALG